MIRYDKIQSYLVTLNPANQEYILKLKLISVEEAVEMTITTATELASIVDLLRNEKNTYYDKEKNEIIIGWEPAGENDPKYDKYGH
jgi:hypothetical protein